jgi:hypothetical protein
MIFKKNEIYIYMIIVYQLQIKDAEIF